MVTRRVSEGSGGTRIPSLTRRVTMHSYNVVRSLSKTLDFWTYAPDSQDFQMQMIQFMKILGLMGAMLMIVANGPGPGSFDKTSINL